MKPSFRITGNEHQPHQCLEINIILYNFTLNDFGSFYQNEENQLKLHKWKKNQNQMAQLSKEDSE